jgi:hypothetical protein
MEKQIVKYKLGTHNGQTADFMLAADTGNELGVAVKNGRRWDAYVAGAKISVEHKAAYLAHFAVKRHYEAMADVRLTEI